MNYLIFYAVVFILAIEAFTVLAQSSEPTPNGVCYMTQAVSSISSRLQYRMAYEGYVRSYGCGWFGRRCNRHLTRSIRQSFIHYYSSTMYYPVHICCSGYVGESPDCQANCTGGCQNGGTCTLPEICTCAEGWTGTNCETDIDECNGDHECDHNCTNIEGSYFCSCDPGYILDEADNTTCQDIDECQDDNGNCTQVCNNTAGSYYCTCLDGYELELTDDNNTCTDVGECIMGTHKCSQFCMELDGGYECYCSNGYELGDDGFTCEDIDECAQGNAGCSQGCRNTDGGFTCTCNQGYQTHHEDPTYCVDIDECVESNGGCQHVCNNSVGSYRCLCDNGYSLGENKHSCEDINECSDSNGGCQHICTNTFGSYYCSCVDDYFLDDNGHSCLPDINAKSSLSPTPSKVANPVTNEDDSVDPGPFITVTVVVLIVILMVLALVVFAFFWRRHRKHISAKIAGDSYSNPLYNK